MWKPIKLTAKEIREVCNTFTPRRFQWNKKQARRAGKKGGLAKAGRVLEIHKFTKEDRDTAIHYKALNKLREKGYVYEEKRAYQKRKKF